MHLYVRLFDGMLIYLISLLHFSATHTDSVEWAGRGKSHGSLAQLQMLKLSVCAKTECSSTVVFMQEINLSPHWVTRDFYFTLASASSYQHVFPLLAQVFKVGYSAVPCLSGTSDTPTLNVQNTISLV